MELRIPPRMRIRPGIFRKIGLQQDAKYIIERERRFKQYLEVIRSGMLTPVKADTVEISHSPVKAKPAPEKAMGKEPIEAKKPPKIKEEPKAEKPVEEAPIEEPTTEIWLTEEPKADGLFSLNGFGSVTKKVQVTQIKKVLPDAVITYYTEGGPFGNPYVVAKYNKTGAKFSVFMGSDGHVDHVTFKGEGQTNELRLSADQETLDSCANITRIKGRASDFIEKYKDYWTATVPSKLASTASLN